MNQTRYQRLVGLVLVVLTGACSVSDPAGLPTGAQASVQTSGQVSGQVDQSTALAALFDEIAAWDDARLPLSALYEGRLPESIAPVDLSAFARQLTQAQALQARLLKYRSTALARQQRLSHQVMAFKLQDTIDRLEFGEQLIPINAEGGFYSAASFAFGRLSFATVADYDAFIRWLPLYARFLESHQALLREGVKQGRVAPQNVVHNNLRMLKVLAATDFESHPDMAAFRRMPESFSARERDRLMAAGAEVFATSLQATYRQLEHFFTTHYLASAPFVPGLSAQPGGRAHYANRVQFFTTLSLSADEVFALGEREVERIAQAMDTVQAELEFSGTRSEFIQQLRTAPEHYPTSGQSLLAQAAWIAKRIEGRLPRWFSPLYELPFTVEPVPAAIAPTYTSGRYVAGDAEQDRPGVYWVNTTKLKSRALFNLPALTLHEAVPGHHLQHARAAQLDGVHGFRRDYYISAFGEGWGLYAEYLGEEMGIYTSAYERFGRLSYEMWRACRLVVDVGLHDRDWSRARAIEYLGSRTALSQLEVVNEIDRYIGWPGQALAYKLGELTIKGLRREAEQQLGANFDIKAFHEAVLGNGSVPLTVLIEEVRLELGLRGSGLPAGLESAPRI